MAIPHTPNILIVDDELEVRQHVCESLARESFRCTGVEGARQALAAIKQGPVDVALLGLSAEWPDDGVWLARRLRDEVRDLAVVVVGAARSMDTAVEAMRIGVIDYLVKPASIEDLVDAVDRAMTWRRGALKARSAREQWARDMEGRTARLASALADSAVASSSALDVWLATVYRSDPQTLAHVRRVARLSSVLALMLGVEGPALGHIERAALAHDLGKLAIPRDLLRMPGPLAADELATVRTHVQAAFDIVSATPFLRPAGDIVLTTRERFNGSGYPRGIGGGAIPVGGRIIAVAEVFEALTSGRGQMDPMSAAVANAELVRAAGVRFDPGVVHAWLRCTDSGVFGHGVTFDEGCGRL